MKLKVAPGSLYTVEDIDAFGLVVAWYPLPRSYYFVDIARIRDFANIRPENSVLVMEHHRLGFVRGNWNIVGNLPHFDAASWPKPQRLAGDQDGLHIPATKTVSLEGRFDYDVDWRRLGLTMDSHLFGIPFPAMMLKKIIETGSVEAGRVCYYPNPKPDGGVWFKEYLEKRDSMPKN